MSTALVTGGAGFIGSHLVDRLIEKGFDVVVIDDLSTGFKENLHSSKVIFYLGRVEDASLVKSVFERHKPDFVFHLAAQISVSRSVREPVYDAVVNINGSLNIMENCVRSAVRKLILTSSGGVMYGENPPQFPTPENVQLLPSSPYGISKLTAEKYCSFFQKEHGLQYTILRYSNVYGPRQNPHGEAGVIAIFIKKMLLGQKVTINGDGECIRDYVYVQDVVRANLLSMDLGDNDVFNIGTSKGCSVNELFCQLQSILAYSEQAEYAEPRAGDLRKSILDASKAKAILGWKPEVAIKEGLALTVQFFKTQLERK